VNVAPEVQAAIEAAPADIELGIAAALERVSRELEQVAQALAKIETIVRLIASAAGAK
jgi:hypothetical protein